MHEFHTKRTCQYTCSLAHANAMALAHTFELDVADTLTLRNSSHRGSGPTLTLVLKVTGSALSGPSTKAASPTQPTPSCSERPTPWPISRCVFWANFGHVSGRPRAHVRVMAIRPSCTGSSLSGYDNIAAGCWLTALSRMCGLHPDSASARPCLFPAKLRSPCEVFTKKEECRISNHGALSQTWLSRVLVPEAGSKHGRHVVHNTHCTPC